MTDHNNQNDSYVDAYNPPADEPTMSAHNDPSADDLSSADDFSSDATDALGADANQASSGSSPNSVSQTLEDQNIFFLLGVVDGSEDEREQFLDELQQVIWDDFLQNDVDLLITEEEMSELKKLMGASDKSDAEVQEDVIIFLEKLVPDLEEIMLEKALELKEDMFRERLLGMEEYYAGDQESLDKVAEAKSLVDDNQWRAAAELLNGMPV